MAHKTSLVVLVALLATGFWISLESRCSAADIKRLIEIIETPKTPEKRPPEIPEQVWATKRDESWVRLRVSAQKDLTGTGGPAVQPLLDLLKRTKDDSVRIVALTALNTMDRAKPAELLPAGPEMVALLKDPNAGVRYLATKTLGVMRYAAGVEQIEKLVTDDEEAVRMIAADALGQVGKFKSAGALFTLLDDKSKMVRLHAINALGDLGAVLEVVPKLIEKLRSEGVNERNAAADALKDLLGYDLNDRGLWGLVASDPDPKRREPLIKDLENWWNDTLKASSKPGAFTIKNKPELTVRVNIMTQTSQKPAVLLKAIEAITRIGDEDAVEYLILAMPEANKDIRKTAADAATRLAKPRGIRIQYLPTDTEAAWIDKVDEFRRRWSDR